MTDASQEGWIRLFNLARDHAAHELHLSNELLGVVDEINSLIVEHKIPEDKAIKITEDLMNAAIKLSDQSKQMSVSVWKLVGGS